MALTASPSTPSPRAATNPAAETSDLRISDFEPLPSPAELRGTLPLGPARAAFVEESRRSVRNILNGDDDRLLAVVGPCSVHDPEAALDYARRLAALSAELRDELRVVMRVYFEKPRTTVGWKGLINDPGLDGTHEVQRGLRTARALLLDVLDLGLPVGCEFLEPTSPQYIADTVSWGAIGARTPESQVHRQLASGLSMPIGFKNATDGDVRVAIDGCVTAESNHAFFGVDDAGGAALVRTTGNPDCHVILRGGRGGPNHGADQVRAALDLLSASDRPRRLVIDASHGNSGKDHVRQAEVAREVAERLPRGDDGAGVAGMMLESFLEPGRQDLDAPEELTYGQSVTDACMGWDETERLLGDLAEAVRRRRG